MASPEVDEVRVIVLGETCTVQVFRRTKSQWNAVGEFSGHVVTAEGGGKQAAIDAWKRKAIAGEFN